MNQLLCIDLSDEKGHIVFNTLLLETIVNDYDITLVTLNKYYNNYKGKFNINIITKQYLINKKTNRYNYPINQLYVLSKTLPLIRKFDNIIFLGYETVTLGLISYLIKKKNILIFNHNNIDKALNSKFRFYFFKHLSKKFKQIVFEDYMMEDLHINYKIKTYVINHPILQVENNKYEIHKRSIFIGSNGTSSQSIIWLDANIKDMFLIVKTKEQLNLQNQNIQQEYFDNYYEYLQKSEFVFVTLDYEYRLSNVILEALAYNKIIISNENKFVLSLKERYPNLIIIIKDKICFNINYNSFSSDLVKFKNDYSQQFINKQIKDLII